MNTVVVREAVVNILGSLIFSGLLAYSWLLWYKAVFGFRTARLCLAIMFQSSFLLVLYSSLPFSTYYSWGSQTIPRMMNATTSGLDSVIAAFPSELEFTYNASMLTPNNNSNYGEVYTMTLDQLSVVDLYLDEMKSTPLVENLRTYQSIGSFFDHGYRIVHGPWARLMDVSRHDLLDIHEFPIGARVRVRLGEEHQEGTVLAYFPSRSFPRFNYTVEFANGHIREIPLIHLAPVQTKFYFFNVDGLVENIPKDAFAVFTRTHVALLQSFSFHFHSYWQPSMPFIRYLAGKSPSPSHNEEVTDHDQCEDAFYWDAQLWEHMEMCPREKNPPKFWFAFKDYPLEEWIERSRLLYFVSSFVCDRNVCSQAVAQRKLAELQTQYAFMFTPGRHHFVFLFGLLFVIQTVVCIVFAAFVATMFLMPVCYVVLNGLCLHADDKEIPFTLCLFAVYASVNSCTLLDSLHLFSGKSLVGFHLLLSCLGVYWERQKSDRVFEFTRNHLLATFSKRSRRHRLVRRIKPNGEGGRDGGDPICRICFCDGEEEPLITPCVCVGTMNFVHESCLNQWRLRAVNQFSAFQCDQCAFPYKVTKTWQDRVFRSSFGLLVANEVLIWMLLFAGALGFSWLEWYAGWVFGGHFVLGPKISAFVKEKTWVMGTPNSIVEQIAVETTTGWLELLYSCVDLGHILLSFRLWGLVGMFFLGDKLAVPWVPGAPDEGLLLLLGGRLAALFMLGHFRLRLFTWTWLKSKTKALFSRNSLVSVELAPWRIPTGTRFKTPFGVARTVRHRLEDDDMVELELEGVKGFKLYRSYETLTEQDTEM